MNDIYVSEYSVRIFPEGDKYLALCPNDDLSHETIKVTYRGEGKWSIDYFQQQYSPKEGWDYVPRDSPDRWRLKFRFDEVKALEIAAEAARIVRERRSVSIEKWLARKEETFVDHFLTAIDRWSIIGL